MSFLMSRFICFTARYFFDQTSTLLVRYHFSKLPYPSASALAAQEKKPVRVMSQSGSEFNFPKINSEIKSEITVDFKIHFLNTILVISDWMFHIEMHLRSHSYLKCYVHKFVRSIFSASKQVFSNTVVNLWYR